MLSNCSEMLAYTWHVLEDLIFYGGQGDGVPKAGHKQAAADSRGSRTCVCANTFQGRWDTQGGKDELTSCRGTV